MTAAAGARAAWPVAPAPGPCDPPPKNHPSNPTPPRGPARATSPYGPTWPSTPRCALPSTPSWPTWRWDGSGGRAWVAGCSRRRQRRWLPTAVVPWSPPLPSRAPPLTAPQERCRELTRHHLATATGEFGLVSLGGGGTSEDGEAAAGLHFFALDEPENAPPSTAAAAAEEEEGRHARPVFADTQARHGQRRGLKLLLALSCHPLGLQLYSDASTPTCCAAHHP